MSPHVYINIIILFLLLFVVTPSGEPHSQCQCQCGVLDDTSRTSPLQGHLTVLKVTVCHTAGHYGEEYDDCSWSEPAIHRPTHLRSSITVNEDSIVCTRTLRLFAAVSFFMGHACQTSVIHCGGDSHSRAIRHR